MLTALKYVGLAIVGAGLLLLVNLSDGTLHSEAGEYYYSSMLRNGYNAVTGCLFLLTGIGVGYFTRLHPWLTGIALISACVVIVFYEATVFRGSHNLLPMELIMYFLYAFPAIMGVYIGRLMYNKKVVGRVK